MQEILDITPEKSLLVAKIERAIEDWFLLAQGKQVYGSNYARGRASTFNQKRLLLEYFKEDRIGSLLDDLRFLYDDYEVVYSRMLKNIVDIGRSFDTTFFL